MPDGSAPNIELTREQIEFLSKYLHVPESQIKGFFKGKGTKRAAAARIKEIKTNYKAYETAKADMDALFKKIETETDLSLCPKLQRKSSEYATGSWLSLTKSGVPPPKNHSSAGGPLS